MVSLDLYWSRNRTDCQPDLPGAFWNGPSLAGLATVAVFPGLWDILWTWSNHEEQGIGLASVAAQLENHSLMVIGIRRTICYTDVLLYS